ncbi:MAG: hypothetical protein SOI66_09110 [Bifidobacterium sp.]
MARRHRQDLGHGIRPRPKSIHLLILLQTHRGALDHDWLKNYQRTYRPIRLEQWLDAPRNRKPAARTTYGDAWQLTREILRDHTSASYAALADWSYTPTGAEISLWDQFELEGRLKRRGWRPWTDRRTDQFRRTKQETDSEHQARMQRRRHLNEVFHITE